MILAESDLQLISYILPYQTLLTYNQEMSNQEIVFQTAVWPSEPDNQFSNEASQLPSQIYRIYYEQPAVPSNNQSNQAVQPVINQNYSHLNYMNQQTNSSLYSSYTQTQIPNLYYLYIPSQYYYANNNLANVSLIPNVQCSTPLNYLPLTYVQTFVAPPSLVSQQEITVENKDALIQAYDGLQEQFFCPINYTILKNPVILTVCGHTFERDAINRWIVQKGKCPLCNIPASTMNIVPNFHLENVIQAYLNIKRRNRGRCMY